MSPTWRVRPMSNRARKWMDGLGWVRSSGSSWAESRRNHQKWREAITRKQRRDEVRYDDMVDRPIEREGQPA